MKVDYKNHSLFSGTVYFSIPGQIAHPIYENCMAGWYLAVDSSLVSAQYRNVFNSPVGSQIPLNLDKDILRQCLSILNLINIRTKCGGKNYFDVQATNALLQSFIAIVAGAYSEQDNFITKNQNTSQIINDFKTLVSKDFRTLKTTSDYAQKLNITPNYLNERVKKHTGFSVSYWITSEILMEAKRLLNHTDLNVNEIAQSIGFDDAAYFSKLFKKHIEITPSAFRAKNLESYPKSDKMTVYNS
ncbi:helix-turn-helix domain-containing protein [Mucilaginibacter sp.]|uniref:helix-turn-helix domain-containing protein n=1 Tax=Mucilaginibacter sp. TaxID=1882438 RepID=UPI003B00B61D